MKFRTLKSSKSERLISDIIKTEMLKVTVTNGVDALGDSYIEVEGDIENVLTLKEIFQAVK